MANNTIQFQCITTVEGNLEALFTFNPEVFVAGDLFWYPVEGRPDIRQAPDVMVVFGRPKGHRGSYLQWQEEGIPPQVVFEIVSPGNRPAEWIEKFLFYQKYGVEEYYVYDPYSGVWDGWLREGETLRLIEKMEGWVSPRLGIRFENGLGTEVGLFHPDGRRFLSFGELMEMVEAERQAKAEALQQAESERREKERALQQAESERLRAERLAQRLRELGIESE